MIFQIILQIIVTIAVYLLCVRFYPKPSPMFKFIIGIVAPLAVYSIVGHSKIVAAFMVFDIMWSHRKGR